MCLSATSSTGQRRQSPRLAAEKQHAAPELLRGTMVKHEFVAHRDEDSVDVRPIQFADNQWLDYVPIRMFAAVTVKERLPAGGTAVLLNPMHTHTDIYLPIDKSQEQLLDAIDGCRTIKDLQQIAADDPKFTSSQNSLCQFIEQLWRHDQIVLDASGR